LAALRSGSAPAAAASLLRQSFGRATKSAKVWRGKSHSERQRKSTARSRLSGRVSLGCGRDADGRWPTRQVVSGCRRVVAQARGLPHRSGPAQKVSDSLAAGRRGLVSHVAKWPGPGCEQVSAANLPGRAGKFATAQRGKSRLASPKKRMVGPRSSERGQFPASGQTTAWPLRTDVVFYFCRLPKKFITAWRFCQVVLFTTNFQPLSSSSARSAPMQWANICTQGTG